MNDSGVVIDRSVTMAMVEKALDVYDPQIRGLWGYKSSLQKPVRKAFEFAHQKAQELPNAVECSRRTLGTASGIKAMFSDSGHLVEVLHRNSVVPEFFLKNAQADVCHALMCVHKTENPVFGSAVVGNRIVRDVRQVQVNFGDHRFAVTASSKEEAHGGARDYFFEEIVRHAVGQKAGIVADRMKRNVAISKLGLGDRLDLLAEVLSNPEKVLHMDHSSVAVSHTGIKQEGLFDEGEYLSFTLPEVKIGDVASPQGLVMVSIPREEIRTDYASRKLDFKYI
ncbi:MAG TPA: hypothetical protein PKH37_06155 [Alphaproteobacteria bacterium]|nr:hypothetical protein [Alphaproteobacteria bacterium]